MPNCTKLKYGFAESMNISHGICSLTVVLEEILHRIYECTHMNCKVLNSKFASLSSQNSFHKQIHLSVFQIKITFSAQKLCGPGNLLGLANVS